MELRLKLLARQMQVNQAATRRAEAALARTDTRSWVTVRRERTRQLIELGGLVQKAGLVDLTDDDRATLYGALLQLADILSGDRGADAKALSKRRGRRAFEEDGAGANATSPRGQDTMGADAS